MNMMGSKKRALSRIDDLANLMNGLNLGPQEFNLEPLNLLVPDALALLAPRGPRALLSELRLQRLPRHLLHGHCPLAFLQPDLQPLDLLHQPPTLLLPPSPPLPTLQHLDLQLTVRAQLALELLARPLLLAQRLQGLLFALLEEVLRPLDAVLQRLDLYLQLPVPGLELLGGVELADGEQVPLLRLLNRAPQLRLPQRARLRLAPHCFQLEVEPLALLGGLPLEVGGGPVPLGDLAFEDLHVLAEAAVLELKLAPLFELQAEFELDLAELPQLAEVIAFPETVVLVEVLRLPLHLLDVLLHLPRLPHAHLRQLLEVPQLLVRRQQLQFQTLQLLQRARKGSVFLLLADAELESGVRGAVNRRTHGVELDLERGMVELQSAVVLNDQLEVVLEPADLLEVGPEQLLLLEELCPQSAHLLFAVSHHSHGLLVVALGLLGLAEAVVRLAVLLGGGEGGGLEGDVVLEGVHGEVELLVLLLAGSHRVLPQSALQRQQPVLQRVDLLEVSLALPLREFEQLVQEQPQVVDALAHPHAQGFSVHCLKIVVIKEQRRRRRRRRGRGWRGRMKEEGRMAIQQDHLMGNDKQK